MNDEVNNSKQIIKGICSILGTGNDLPDGEIKKSLQELNELNEQISPVNNDKNENNKIYVNKNL